ncbi:MAG: hypothetical protein KBC73_20070 [Burkholderiaceae bacterium]|nr:hypothetical protein [Burkholderiaceae bacterium]
MARRLRRAGLLALAALVGCAGGAGQVGDALDAGPLRLQQLEQRSGLQISVNHSGRVTYYTLQLQHRGRPVPLPDAGSGRLRQTNDARQGWLLADAPQPAALLATDRWLLVTEQDGQPRVQEIAPGGRQWRWLPLDPGGTAGPARAETAAANGSGGRVLTEPQPRLSLSGGRRLLLEDSVLLDLATLRVQPLNASVPAGYSSAEAGIVSAAPDGSAIARLYLGPSRQPRDALLLVRATDRDQQALLPLDLAAYTDDQGRALTAGELLQRHGRWQPARDGGPAVLQLDAPPQHGPWRSRYELGLRAPRIAGRPWPRFTLEPVRPSALAAAVAAALAPDFQPRPPLPGDPPPERQVRLWLDKLDVEVLLRLDGERLVIESDASHNPDWSQSLVRRLGERLEERLRAGGWREHLAAR